MDKAPEQAAPSQTGTIPWPDIKVQIRAVAFAKKPLPHFAGKGFFHYQMAISICLPQTS
jgi:hypothetical protein